MGMIRVHINPFRREDRRGYSHDGPFIDFLLRKFPDGFSGPTVTLLNGHLLRVEDFDKVVSDSDEIALFVYPALPAAAFVAKIVVGALISAAVSYVASWLLGSGDTSVAAGTSIDSPTYATGSTPSISPPSNRARQGSAIPVIYGEVLSVPDLIAQPYTVYVGNDQFLIVLLGIGQGEHRVDYVQLGDTRQDQLAAGTITVWDFPPSVHLQTFGVIADAIGYPENMETSAEVGDQDFTYQDWSGEFSANTQGTTTKEIWCDAVFPGGLFSVAPSTGAITTASVDLEFMLTLISDSGVQLADPIIKSFTVTAESKEPVRKTYSMSVPRGRYKVSARRTTALDDTTTIQTRCVWGALRASIEREDSETVTLYQFDSTTETDLSAWTVTGDTTWGLIATRACGGGEIRPASVNPTFIAADVSNLTTSPGTTSIARVFDFDSEAYTPIDEGSVTYAFAVTLANQAAGEDTGTVYYDILDAADQSLEQQSVVSSDSCVWSARAVTGIVPVSARKVRVTCEAATATGNVAGSYFDDITMVLTGFVPENPVAAPVYGDLHIVAVRIKATDGIAASARASVAVRCAKKIDGVVNHNVIDQVLDVYTNPGYGGGRPLSEVDTDRMNYLRAQETDSPGFNGVFDQRITVWEALRRVARVADMFPTTDGGLLSLLNDRYQTTVDFAFSESNIAQDSLAVSYRFDAGSEKDGYEVEYRDPDTFLAAYTLFPETSVAPEPSVFWGCTSSVQAYQQARFLWLKNLYRRTRAAFKTETDGHIPLAGSLVTLQHPLVGDGETPTPFIVDKITPSSQYSVQVEAMQDVPEAYGGASPGAVDCSGYTFTSLIERDTSLWTDTGAVSDVVPEQFCYDNVVNPATDNAGFIRVDATTAAAEVTRVWDVSDSSVYIDNVGTAITLRVKAAAISNTVQARVDLLDAADGVLGTFSTTTSAGCGWEELSVVLASVPVGTRSLRVALIVASASSSRYFGFFDDIVWELTGCSGSLPCYLAGYEDTFTGAVHSFPGDPNVDYDPGTGWQMGPPNSWNLHDSAPCCGFHNGQVVDPPLGTLQPIAPAVQVFSIDPTELGFLLVVTLWNDFYVPPSDWGAVDGGCVSMQLYMQGAWTYLTSTGAGTMYSSAACYDVDGQFIGYGSTNNDYPSLGLTESYCACKFSLVGSTRYMPAGTRIVRRFFTNTPDVLAGFIPGGPPVPVASARSTRRAAWDPVKAPAQFHPYADGEGAPSSIRVTGASPPSTREGELGDPVGLTFTFGSVKYVEFLSHVGTSSATGNSAAAATIPVPRLNERAVTPRDAPCKPCDEDAMSARARAGLPLPEFGDDDSEDNDDGEVDPPRDLPNVEET